MAMSARAPKVARVAMADMVARALRVARVAMARVAMMAISARAPTMEGLAMLARALRVASVERMLVKAFLSITEPRVAMEPKVLGRRAKHKERARKERRALPNVGIEFEGRSKGKKGSKNCSPSGLQPS